MNEEGIKVWARPILVINCFFLEESKIVEELKLFYNGTDIICLNILSKLVVLYSDLFIMCPFNKKISPHGLGIY